jgi:hypothetical protein
MCGLLGSVETCRDRIARSLSENGGLNAGRTMFKERLIELDGIAGM